MWASESMTFYESFVTFLIGFTVVFICLMALAIFIIISSKIVSIITNAISSQEKQPNETTMKTGTKTSTSPKDDQGELEKLAVIISAISEEMREPVENFKVVSIKEI